MTALILQHPKAPVTFLSPEDYPETPQSVRAAWLESNRERAKLGIPLHPRPSLRLVQRESA